MGEVKDADYDQDMKLPFKSQDDCVSTISNIYIPLSESFSIQQPKQVAEVRTFAIEDVFLLPYFHSAIWHPPRVC